MPSLDGDGDYVQLPTHIFNELNEATVECWVKWTPFNYFSQPFGFGRAWQAMAVNNSLTSSDLQFFIYLQESQLYLIKVPEILQLNRWYHIAAVTGKNGMKLYLDGVLVGEHAYTGSFSSIRHSHPKNYLGRSQWKDNADFYGQLDEVRVWGVARTGAQIQDTMGMFQIL